jgi:glycosyltransferase involved in cell wall biosynthesis
MVFRSVQYSNQARRPRVLFLYANERSRALKEVEEGNNHGAGFWGMVHLPKHGVDASFVELEQWLSPGIAAFLRKRIIHTYFIHVPFFLSFFRYDIIYTSASFGTQLLFTLYPFRKPLWVMNDFSIISMLGNGRTWKQRLFHFMVRRCSGIVTLGESEAEKLRTLFPHLRSQIVCIPYGADITFLQPDWSMRKQGVFSVGRDPDRDWKSLITIAPKLLDTVTIATHERRIAPLRPLPENVVVGQFTLPKLIEEYQKAKVFVLPLDTSKGVNDAMGVSVIHEALAHGKAIVATDTHTMRTYITHGENGLLVPERDGEALYNAIARILRDDDERLRLERAARRFAEEHLNIDDQTEKLARYFRMLLAEAGRQY